MTEPSVKKAAAKKAASKPAIPKASVSLEGSTADHFQAVKDSMMSKVPGIDPNNSEVVKHALYMADEYLSRPTPTTVAGMPE